MCQGAAAARAGAGAVRPPRRHAGAAGRARALVSSRRGVRAKAKEEGTGGGKKKIAARLYVYFWGVLLLNIISIFILNSVIQKLIFFSKGTLSAWLQRYCCVQMQGRGGRAVRARAVRAHARARAA